LERELGDNFEKFMEAAVEAVQGKKSSEENLLALVGERYEDILRQATKEIQMRQALERRQQMLQELDRLPEWFNYVAAAIAAIASTLVVHPIDTIKTRLMAGKSAQTSKEQSADERDTKEPSLSLADIPDLYQGVVGNMVKEGPSSALYLGVYEAAKARLLASPLSTKPLVVYLISGALGEFFGSIFRAPAEAIKTNVQTGMSPSAASAVQDVFGSATSRSKVFSAWTASVWRDIPFGATQLAIFESLKSFLVESPDIQIDPDNFLVEALLGAIGGAVGAYISTPFDVITTRINTEEVREGEQPLSFFEMAGKVLEEEGPQGFMAGWRERVLYWGPAVSLFLTSYCWVRQAAVAFF
jgi:hypothetical protein